MDGTAGTWGRAADLMRGTQGRLPGHVWSRRADPGPPSDMAYVLAGLSAPAMVCCEVPAVQRPTGADAALSRHDALFIRAICQYALAKLLLLNASQAQGHSVLITQCRGPAADGSVKNLGHSDANWNAWWPKRLSSTVALT